MFESHDKRHGAVNVIPLRLVQEICWGGVLGISYRESLLLGT